MNYKPMKPASSHGDKLLLRVHITLLESNRVRMAARSSTARFILIINEFPLGG
jgi:hypothetical protein